MDAPPPGVPAKPPGPAPNETLYVRNLNDHLQKSDLKRMLYMLFASYGVILDIVALKTEKMRGQAHIVFRDIDSATQAMRALDGFSLCGKEMTISYAKGRSKVFAKLQGTVYASEKSEKSLPAAGATDQSKASAAAFGAAPAKAVPVNEQDRAKGVKRAREEDEEEEAEKNEKDNNGESDDSEAEMQISDEDSD